ncbi:MAG TPA: adenosylmethionine--8-amino-7-oxononanoate transaminase [Chitinophagaceae bacterium]
MQKSLVERDKAVIWHPYTQMQLAPDPLVIVKGEGVFLVDASGNRYIDAISSWWVNLHGHAHPYLAKKVYEQAQLLEHVIFAGFTHEPAVTLAERLISILPGKLSKVFYSDNGSTAVEVALKMAIQYWKNKETESQDRPGKKKILALANSYHGDTFGAMSVSERGQFTLPFRDQLFEVVFADFSNAGWQMMNNGELVSMDSLNWEEFVCFIYEPVVQGAGGMKMMSVEALELLLKRCRQHNIICIADEVMTGFGRTGKLFASEYIGEKPDIICLSKGLTGGMMALGATVCTKEIFDAFLSTDRMKTFFHGHSYTANPLACAAGNASLDLLLMDECMQNIDRISNNHKKFIQRISNSFPAVKNVRQTGTILAFEIETGVDGYLNNIGTIVHRKALEKGVLIRPLGNTVYLMPPYCSSDNELEIIYNVIEHIIRSI